MPVDRELNRNFDVLREVLAGLALVAGCYLLISLMTHTPFDGGMESRLEGGEIKNMGGPVGAKIAHLLLLMFGYSAYFVVAAAVGAVWIALACAFQSDLHWTWLVGTATGLALLLVCSSSLEALRFASNAEFLPGQRSGGILGQSVARPLYRLFGFHGATLILLGFWLSGLSLFANFTWAEVSDKSVLFLKRANGLMHLVFKKSWRLSSSLRGGETSAQQCDAERHQTISGRQPAQDKSVRPSGRSWGNLFKSRVPDKEDKELLTKEKTDNEPSFTKRQQAAEVSATEDQAAENKKSGTLRSARKRPASSSVGSPLPSAKLLSPASPNNMLISDEYLRELARLIAGTLAEFGVQATVTVIQPGPVVTRFEIEPATGVKGSQIVNLGRELARALAVQSIRILETIPGKKTMGIEVPNPKRATVPLQDVIASAEFSASKSPVTLALGRDIAGKPVTADLQDMPHLLVAGTTGSGKSVQINSMILSILFKASPEQVRLILIDPKVVELAAFDGLPHLYAPVVTDMANVPGVLSWCVAEMERRYRLMAEHGARNISGLNAVLASTAQSPQNMEHNGEGGLEPLPLIVVIIDELADLMAVVGKKVELLINRLAQKARAAGIHLVLATQRPSVDVITGLIKANIPSRIAFQVSSKIDSRTILDQSGAETLLGKGDMLYLPGGISVPERVHGAYVSDEEVQKVVAHVTAQSDSRKYQKIEFTGSPEDAESNASGTFASGGNEEDGDMYRSAVEVVLSNQRASISLVQRQLRIGYNRAARIIEQMERNGLISPMDSNGSRKILVSEGREH